MRSSTIRTGLASSRRASRRGEIHELAIRLYAFSRSRCPSVKSRSTSLVYSTFSLSTRSPFFLDVVGRRGARLVGARLVGGSTLFQGSFRFHLPDFFRKRNSDVDPAPCSQPAPLTGWLCRLLQAVRYVNRIMIFSSFVQLCVNFLKIVLSITRAKCFRGL